MTALPGGGFKRQEHDSWRDSEGGWSMGEKRNLDEEIAEVERQLEDLRKRLPAHSLKVSMAMELDELEERLNQLLEEKKRQEKAGR